MTVLKGQLAVVVFLWYSSNEKFPEEKNPALIPLPYFQIEIVSEEMVLVVGAANVFVRILPGNAIEQVFTLVLAIPRTIEKLIVCSVKLCEMKGS